MKIHIGTSGFGYKEWKGRFYPEKITPREMLRFYAEHLDAVEINNTFYHMPTEGVLRSWAEQVPPDFVFAFKAPQVVTHYKRLRSVDDETAYLVRTLSLLGGRLGPVLFQFPKSFRADRAALEGFLALIPDGIFCAFEFRSPTWLTADILHLLRARNGSLCIADTDEAPAQEIVPTAAWGYLRLRRADYPEAELAEWRDRIRAQAWEKAFVFFKHEETARGPEMALRFRALVDLHTAPPGPDRS